MSSKNSLLSLKDQNELLVLPLLSLAAFRRLKNMRNKIIRNNQKYNFLKGCIISNILGTEAAGHNVVIITSAVTVLLILIIVQQCVNFEIKRANCSMINLCILSSLLNVILKIPNL